MGNAYKCDEINRQTVAIVPVYEGGHDKKSLAQPESQKQRESSSVDFSFDPTCCGEHHSKDGEGEEYRIENRVKSPIAGTPGEQPDLYEFRQVKTDEPAGAMNYKGSDVLPASVVHACKSASCVVPQVPLDANGEDGACPGQLMHNRRPCYHKHNEVDKKYLRGAIQRFGQV